MIDAFVGHKSVPGGHRARPNRKSPQTDNSENMPRIFDWDLLSIPTVDFVRKSYFFNFLTYFLSYSRQNDAESD